MGKNKLYAVKKGLVPGVYNSWAECQHNTNGFPGAEYKSFNDKGEAEAYISGISESDNEPPISRVYMKSEALAYVDGCYNQDTMEYSYGVVMFYNGIEEHYSEKFSNNDMVSMRNVAGEIEGAMRAMQVCLSHNIKSLDLVYDYEGIEKWCTGAWKANKVGTRKFKSFYNKIKDNVKVTFIKVKSHSGNKFNDLADQLAKSAVGLGTSPISEHDNGIVAHGIKYDDLESVLELLSEDFMDLDIRKKDISYGVNFSLVINNPNNQLLSLNYYNGKEKLHIQGRKEDLFNRLSLYIAELLDINEIPKFLNTVHNIDIDVDIIDDKFIKMFPNSYDKLPKEVNNYLHQAVYNLHIKGNNMYTTNFLVEPAIRPLEAFLKLILLDNDLPIRGEDKEVDTFFIFREKNDHYELHERFILEKHSGSFIKYLNRCFTYFKKNRNTLFHWDNPKETIDTTRVLHTVEEAHTIIRDIIDIIDSYYLLE